MKKAGHQSLRELYGTNCFRVLKGWGGPVVEGEVDTVKVRDLRKTNVNLQRWLLIDDVGVGAIIRNNFLYINIDRL